MRGTQVDTYETKYQGRLAEMICQTIPCAEQVRFANAGTEATLAAIRLARAVTGRQKILKFEGHFHGLHDYVMWNSGGPPRDEFPTYPYVPPSVESGGVPPQIADFVIVIPWNDPAALDQAMREHGEEFAAVICEPVSYNAGCLMPKPGFLNLLREQATKYGAVLIFDEILSGFRMAPGGAQEYYSVTPDVATFGKAISGGVPMAVIAGKREFMQQFSPLGPAVHSGTYSGHLFAVLAAIATLEEVRREGLYDEILAKAEHFYSGLDSLFAQYDVPVKVQGLGSCFAMHFGVHGEIWDWQDVVRGNRELWRRFSSACIERGVYFQTYPAKVGGADHQQFSAVHTMADIDETLNRIESALRSSIWV